MSSDSPVPKSFGLTYDPPSITVVYALNEKLRACMPHSPPCDCAGRHTLRLILHRQAHDARARAARGFRSRRARSGDHRCAPCPAGTASRVPPTGASSVRAVALPGPASARVLRSRRPPRARSELAASHQVLRLMKKLVAATAAAAPAAAAVRTEEGSAAARRQARQMRSPELRPAQRPVQSPD